MMAAVALGRGEYDCSICLDSISAVDKKILEMCGHEFHRLCIEPWLARSNTCPNCRRPQIALEIGVPPAPQRERSWKYPLAAGLIFLSVALALILYISLAPNPFG